MPERIKSYQLTFITENKADKDKPTHYLCPGARIKVLTSNRSSFAWARVDGEGLVEARVLSREDEKNKGYGKEPQMRLCIAVQALPFIYPQHFQEGQHPIIRPPGWLFFAFIKPQDKTVIPIPRQIQFTK
ncbi:MAG: hypothetical protein WC489_04355 [Patescibacteria group bacterium]